MFWNRIVEWFENQSERQELIQTFNLNAKEAFIMGESPTLLKATSSRGDRTYKHSFSNWMFSGFRIKVISGRNLTKQEMIDIGESILGNNVLVRRFVLLGWDTLEIQGTSPIGIKWQLSKYINIPDSNLLEK